MGVPVRLLRQFGWLAVVCALLGAPRAARAEQSVFADFDGDGRRDEARVDDYHRRTVSVWLSATQRSRVLRTARPILQLAAGDLDGDGRAELVAAGGDPGLVVWKTNHKSKFKLVRSKPLLPRSLRMPSRQLAHGPIDPVVIESGGWSPDLLGVQRFDLSRPGPSIVRVSLADHVAARSRRDAPAATRGPPAHS
jgi:hypothetical protein